MTDAKTPFVDQRGFRCRVLGHTAGACRGHPSMAALLDESTLLDAGTGASALYETEMQRIDSLLLTHSHLDHIVMLGFLADARSEYGGLDIYCLEATARSVRENIFNGTVWPKMHEIIVDGKPIIRFHPLTPFEQFNINGRAFTPLPAEHTIDTLGFCMHSSSASFVWFSDFGGADDAVFDYINKLDDLKYLVIETSFPNEKQELADVSKHLTPQTLKQTVDRLTQKDLEIFIGHVKPASAIPIHSQVIRLNDTRLGFLQPSQLFIF